MSALLQSVIDGTAPGLVLLQVEQLNRMIAAGVLPADASVELIDGLLIPRDRVVPNQEARTAALKARRESVVARLQEMLSRAFAGSDLQVRLHLPITLGPLQRLTPDVSVFRGAVPVSSNQPQKVDLALVIEVADTTLAFDRGVKGRVYAMAGVPNVWIVNLVDGTVESYSGPEPSQKKFAKGEVVNRDGTLTMVIGTGEPISLSVRDLLSE